ncbi:MAG: FKBP-type peptidyl-prolyl cis-trans isomerase [Bacteroidales bacterium]|nr:FKBP-type peptidyl-prolyl cis-trans isomerase [Bacteroidales bacterium]
MKKTYILFAMAATVVFFAACNRGAKPDKDGFYTAESGLMYKFIEKHEDARLVEMDDLLEGEMAIVFEGDTLFSNIGHPDLITRVEDDWFQGGHNEAFLMMHEGEHAVFGISADSIAKFLEPTQMPQGYKPNQNMRIYYDVHLTHILSKEDIAKREADYMAEMNKKQEAEAELIKQYLANNKITVKPTESGLYVVVKKAGTGKKAENGSTVSVYYAGRLLNGKLFDTNIESVAKAEGRQGGHFQPFAFTLGQRSVIRGWEEGIVGLKKGAKATLIIPSNLAYGASGAGNDIPPYSPLVFDVEVVSVN